MASKRHLRRNGCEGKVRYEDREKATADAWRLKRKFGEWLVSYHCQFCNGWHIGHPTARARQSIMARRGTR